MRLNPDECMTDLVIDHVDEGFRERIEERFWRLTQELAKAGLTVVLDDGF